MALNFDLQNTGQEVQEILDFVHPSADQQQAEINTLKSDVRVLHDMYAALDGSNLVVLTEEEWQAMTSWQTRTIYRVAGVNEYQDYMWDGVSAEPTLLATYDNRIDEEPTAYSNNLVKSGGVEKELPVFRLVGNNDDIVYSSYFSVKAGNTYRVWVKNPDVDMTGVTRTTGAYKRFAVSAYDDSEVSVEEYIVDVTCKDKAYRLADYYDVTIPQGASFIRLMMRASQGEELTVVVEDVTTYKNNVQSLYNSSGKIVSIAEASESELTGFNINGYWNQGVFISGSIFRVHYYPVVEGETYYLTASRIAGTTVQFGSWFDNQGNLIYGEPYYGDIEQPVSLTNKLIHAPKGAAYFGLNISNSVKAGFGLKTYLLVDSVSEIDGLKEIVSRMEVMTTAEVMDRCYVTESGLQEDVGTYDIYVYPVQENTLYSFSDNIDAGNASNRFVSWWNADRELISIEPYKGDPLGGSRVYFRNQVVKSPIGAAYAYLSGKSAHSYPYRVFKELFPIKSSDLEDAINPIVPAVRESVTMTPVSIKEGYYIGADKLEHASSKSNEWIYEVEGNKLYLFSGRRSNQNTTIFLAWLDASQNVIMTEPYKGSTSQVVVYRNQYVTSPSNAAYAVLNVQIVNTDYHRFAQLGEPIRTEDAIDDVEATIENAVKSGSLMVSIADDKSFSVRFHIDEENDGILFFGYYQPFKFYKNNSFMHRRFYVGKRDQTNSEIFENYSTGQYQDCYDCLMPVSSINFGPMYANHGLSAPRLVIDNSENIVTSDEVGTEWVDQQNWHYTLIAVSGNNLYMLPVFYNTDDPGHEYREWRSYISTYPTQITRVSGGDTIPVESHARFDFQVAKTQNIMIMIDGAEKPAGTYYCNELEVTHEQLCYNPMEIQTWWEHTDLSNVGLMGVFKRQMVVSGCDGFLSLAAQTSLDIKHPIAANLHAIGVMLPLSFIKNENDEMLYDVYVYIDKVLKPGYTEEFISNVKSGYGVDFYRNSSDITDVDNMPDRAYAYMKNKEDDSILFGCAGGVSIVRGDTIPDIRNTNIPTDRVAANWGPASSNKMYFRVVNRSPENDDNILGTSYLGNWEVFMAWYKPENDVQSFYYKSGDEYILYIHTKGVHIKEPVKVPSLMNGLSVKGVVEQSSNNISYLNSIIVDGTLYVNSGSGYEYLVLKIG